MDSSPMLPSWTDCAERPKHLNRQTQKQTKKYEQWGLHEELQAGITPYIKNKVIQKED